MEAVVGLLLMLLGVSHGIETYCDGRQNRTQCYGALGGSVVIRLMNSASEIHRYEWKKNKAVILIGKRNNVLSNLTGTRFSFTPSDGTFRINYLNRDDSGEYILETFDKTTGTISEHWTLQLLIQAPVSSVLLVSECLSQGEMRVSCSSEGGDSPQYSWTLDGHSLTDAELLSRNNETNNNITLKQNVSGRLVCSVRNHISIVSNEAMISSCGFIFINCTLDNGTRVAMWVLEAKNTLCISPTTNTPAGIETYCDGRQSRAQCYGALGGSVVVRLMNSASEIYRYEWKKNKEVILSGKMNRIESDLTGTRFSFTPSDGTFRINNLNRGDSGEYILDIFELTGRQLEPQTLQLLIQAPVSSVLLVSECLSQVLMRVSCSSEGGDSPQYSWTLDGRSLTDSELLCGNNETNVIILNQDVSGSLVCSVRNHINSVSKETMISTCDHSLLIFGLEAAVFILSVIGIIVYFTWKKKKYKKRESSRATRPEEYSANSVVMVEMRSSASGL